MLRRDKLVRKRIRREDQPAPTYAEFDDLEGPLHVAKNGTEYKSPPKSTRFITELQEHGDIDTFGYTSPEVSQRTLLYYKRPVRLGKEGYILTEGEELEFKDRTFEVVSVRTRKSTATGYVIAERIL